MKEFSNFPPTKVYDQALGHDYTGEQKRGLTKAILNSCRVDDAGITMPMRLYVYPEFYSYRNLIQFLKQFFLPLFFAIITAIFNLTVKG